MRLLFNNFMLYARYVFIAVVFCLTACSGGGVGSSAAPVPPRSVYVADQDTAGVFELYIVDSTSPGISTKLNSALGGSAETWLLFSLVLMKHKWSTVLIKI